MRKFLFRFVMVLTLILPMPISVFLMAFLTDERKPGTALIGFMRGWCKMFKKGGDVK